MYLLQPMWNNLNPTRKWSEPPFTQTRKDFFLWHCSKCNYKTNRNNIKDNRDGQMVKNREQEQLVQRHWCWRDFMIDVCSCAQLIWLTEFCNVTRGERLCPGLEGLHYSDGDIQILTRRVPNQAASNIVWNLTYNSPLGYIDSVT